MSHVALEEFKEVNIAVELITLWDAVRNLSKEKARPASEAAVNLLGFGLHVGLPAKPLIGADDQSDESYVDSLVSDFKAASDAGAPLAMGKIDWSKVLAWVLKVLPIIIPLVVEPETQG